MLTEAQLAERKTYIGSSDAKAVASGDIVEWDNLAAIKRGDKEFTVSKDVQLKMDVGSYMESFIIDKWQEMSGIETNMRGAGRTQLFSGIPLHSTFDAMIVGSKIPVEIKCHFGFMDMEELMELYSPQIQHHMLVSGTDSCMFVVFHGLRCTIRWQKVVKDNDWCGIYLLQAKKFWDFYQGNGVDNSIYALPPIVYDDMYTMNLRDHEEYNPDFDATLNIAVENMIDYKGAEYLNSESKNMFKDWLPSGCKKMTYDLQGNRKGWSVVVTRSKSGTVTCRLNSPKDGE
jgi:hypothetical protein